MGSRDVRRTCSFAISRATVDSRLASKTFVALEVASAFLARVNSAAAVALEAAASARSAAAMQDGTSTAAATADAAAAAAVVAIAIAVAVAAAVTLAALKASS